MKKLIKFFIPILLFAFMFTNIGGDKIKTRSDNIPIKQILSDEEYSFDSIPLSSQHFLLAKLDDFSVVAGKNTSKKAYPASLTKIMTVIVTLENIEDLDKEVIVDPDIFPILQVEQAALAGFNPGETTSIKDLLYASILPSGAEACVSLAREVSGSEEEFVKLMNAKAKKLKMRSSHFTNTTGLHHKDHYTSTEDLTKLLVYALNNEIFYEIFTSDSYSVDRASYHKDNLYLESTLFSAIKNNDLENDFIIGGKTGYTEKAGLCLASLGQVDGEKYILINLKAEGGPNTPPQHIIDALNIYGHLRSK